MQSDASLQPMHVPVSPVSQTGRSGSVQSSVPSHAGAVGSGMHVWGGPNMPVSSQKGRLPPLSHESSALTPAFLSELYGSESEELILPALDTVPADRPEPRRLATATGIAAADRGQYGQPMKKAVGLI